MPFTVYIDESGEAGIARVRSENGEPGASPYFVLGAAVMQPAAQIHARQVLELVSETISKKKWRHATDLDHSAKVFFARMSAQIKLRYFAVVSNKSTLGDYKELIEADPQKFYNKCLKYLLEIVCAYLSNFSVCDSDVSVILEKRNHDYDAMLRYLIKVRENPIYSESKSLRLLNPFSIVARSKEEDDLLVYADLVAHAVYQCTNKSLSNYHIPEPRYLRELSGRFGADNRGVIIGTGIKCIHDLQSLQLDKDIQKMFSSLRAELPRRHVWPLKYESNMGNECAHLKTTWLHIYRPNDEYFLTLGCATNPRSTGLTQH